MFSKIALRISLLFFVSTTFSQTDTGEQVHIKLINVSNKVYMLQGDGGNIALSFGNDGTFMVDAQGFEGIEQVQKNIKRKSDSPVPFLVNTHFHEDHTGGNSKMAKIGTIIISHENVRAKIQEMMRKETRKVPQETVPTVTFTEAMNFYFNNEKIHVFHVPNAHTDGDAMVYFSKSNVLHTGDVFFNGTYPFIDIENGGSLTGCITGLEKAFALIDRDTKIIPGHGNLATYQDLRKSIEMLTILYKRVTQEYIKGKTEEEVAANKTLTSDYDALGYGDGSISAESFLKILYKAVAKERADIDQNAEKNRKAREKVKKMMEESKQN